MQNDNQPSHQTKQKSETRLFSAASEFFRLEASGGILLVIAAIIALILANTPLYQAYNYILNEVNFIFGFEPKYETGEDFAIQKSVLLWINDGLMAIFFFLVGLEIKRELLEGELASRDRALLPALAAIGGMVVPASIYIYLTQGHAEAMNGWAIPAATDIAFALGIIALVGKRAPTSLKILLAAIAIIDDLGAILIIALFYTAQLKTFPLIFAAGAMAGLITLNRYKVSAIAPYILLGIVLWVAILESGIHATLAGVLTALCIPLKDRNNPNKSPLHNLEHNLHPWVAFMVLPIFAFANAGVSFEGMTIETLINPVTLGIALALFFGKQLGVFSALWLTIILGLSPKPRNATWLQLYAVSLLCGVGFTMSLFIGALAFDTADMAINVRLGVILGSIAAAVSGYLILRFAPQKISNG